MSGSIAAIITLGLGTWGSPSLITTLGYGVGEAATAGDTISVTWADRSYSFSWADRGNLTGTWANRSYSLTWGDIFDG